MRFTRYDSYRNRQSRVVLDHIGGQIYGNCDVVRGGDYLHNGNVLLPVGSIVQYVANTAPGGWLLCDGREVKINDYRRLYVVIGNNFGTASSSDSFLLPDLRGRVPLGKGQGSELTNRVLGAMGGEETHILISDEMPIHTHGGSTQDAGAHNHTINDQGHFHTINGQAYISGQNTTVTTDNSPNEIDTHNLTSRTTSTTDTGITINDADDHNHDFTTNETGGGVAHNNMQPYLVVNYIIRY